MSDASGVNLAAFYRTLDIAHLVGEYWTVGPRCGVLLRPEAVTATAADVTAGRLILSAVRRNERTIRRAIKTPLPLRRLDMTAVPVTTRAHVTFTAVTGYLDSPRGCVFGPSCFYMLLGSV